jgi:CRP-like cAMP-binding protein
VRPTPLLELLRPDERAELCRIGTVIPYEVGAVLLRRGEPSTHVVVLESGRAKVMAAGDGNDLELAVRGSGDILGEMAFFTGGPRSSTVVATEPVVGRVVAADAFRSYLHRFTRVHFVLTGQIVLRLRESDQARQRQRSTTVKQRVARTLVDHTDTLSATVSDGPLEVPVSQSELAHSVGASREAVAKALRALREERVVSTARTGITVLDRERLAVHAAD